MMFDKIADLLREEINLPDTASPDDVIELFKKIDIAKASAFADKDTENLQVLEKIERRLSTRIIPEQVGENVAELAKKMLIIGRELDTVNRRRATLYYRAQAVMLQATEEGISQSEIARILGVDRATVRNATTRVVKIETDEKKIIKRVPITYEEFKLTVDKPEEIISRERHPAYREGDE